MINTYIKYIKVHFSIITYSSASPPLRANLREVFVGRKSSEIGNCSSDSGKISYNNRSSLVPQVVPLQSIYIQFTINSTLYCITNLRANDVGEFKQADENSEEIGAIMMDLHIKYFTTQSLYIQFIY